MDGKSYRQGETAAQTLTVSAVSGVRVTTQCNARATSLLSRMAGGALPPIW